MTLKRELAATVIIAAAFTTDEKACRQYGVSVRSLQRWRRQLADGDPELAGFVATKKEAFDKTWAEQLPIALKTGLQCLSECMDTIANDAKSKKNPEVIHAIAGALSICAEIYFTGKVIDIRFTQPYEAGFSVRK